MASTWTPCVPWCVATTILATMAPANLATMAPVMLPVGSAGMRIRRLQVATVVVATVVVANSVVVAQTVRVGIAGDVAVMTGAREHGAGLSGSCDQQRE